MITNDQLDAEIDEVTSRVSQMLTSVRGIFADCARLRAQVELLKRLRDLRVLTEADSEPVSLILLGIVVKDELEPHPFCAATWSGELVSPRDTRLFLRTDWKSLTTPEISPYLSDLLEDWKRMLRTEPEAMLALIAGLCAGPLRTIEFATLQRERVAEILRYQLVNFQEFPTWVTPIS